MRASFSASEKVAGETSGPTAGPVPKAGGAPGVVGEGSWASAFRETATPKRPREVWERNCLREFGMDPPRGSILTDIRKMAGRLGSARSKAAAGLSHSKLGTEENR